MRIKSFLNFFTVVVCILYTFFLGSCKKFLNQMPITSYGTNIVFSDIPHAYQALAGVYSQLSGDQGYGIRLSLYYTVDNDETQGPTGNGDNDRRDIARYQATPGNAQLDKPFRQLFTGIEYANICIYNIPTMTQYNNGTNQEKKELQRMYGEALTLRAQFYLEAIRNWGDLPANFLPASQVAGAYPFPTRVNRDSLYDRILSDLKIAEDLVPWRNDLSAIGDPQDERITKGTVKGLRARIALFRGGYSLRNTSGQMERSADYLNYYQMAHDECNDIITSGQHNLNPNYKNLFKNYVCGKAVSDPDGELMFQVSAVGANGTADSKLGYYDGPTVNGNGNKSINILPTYFYLFDSTDLRRDVTCAPYIVNADGMTKTGQTITAINDGKYRRDWISNPPISPTDKTQYLGLKWQILRYADVLLMYAETENELNGPTAAAYNAVNMVRRRGYGKPINTPNALVDLPSGLSKSDFFNAIVKERSLELGTEGVRKYDLIRWNLINTVLNNTKNALIAMSNSSGVYANLPKSMYYYKTAIGDDYTIWANSLYKPAPSTTPANTSKITWVSSAIATTTLGRFATGFTPNKSELLPIPQPARDANYNLTQNPGY